MSTNINPSTKVSVGVNKTEIKFIAGQMRLTAPQVIALIRNILSDTLVATIQDLREWINKFVPKRTGQLRQSLLDNLQSSKVQETIMRIILGTHINYAEKVNQYATGQVRHSGPLEHSGKKAYAYYYGNYGPIYLNDPQAIGNFWDKLLEYAKQRVRVNLLSAKRRYLGFQSGSSPIYKAVKV